MVNILKGNYELEKSVEIAKKEEFTLEEQLERKALKSLGGSMAFVAKQKVLWDSNDNNEPNKAEK